MNKDIKANVLTLNANKTEEIKQTWEKRFVPMGIDRDKIHLYDHGFLWHIFSYKVRECEQGKSAINKFNEISKSSIFIFYQHKDIGYMINNIQTFTDVDLRQFIDDFESSDIYATDKDFKWTFVKTHEDGWLGPYFCELQ